MDIGLKQKLKEGLTAEEAILNLTTISNMVVDEKTPVGILKEKRLTTEREDFSYKEIADITGLTPSNVGVKINRIKKTLKTLLGGPK